MNEWTDNWEMIERIEKDREDHGSDWDCALIDGLDVWIL